MDDHFDTSGVFEISKFDILKLACIKQQITTGMNLCLVYGRLCWTFHQIPPLSCPEVKKSFVDSSTEHEI